MMSVVMRGRYATVAVVLVGVIAVIIGSMLLVLRGPFNFFSVEVAVALTSSTPQ